MQNFENLEAVERERESYTLKIKSVTLFNSLTHTGNLIIKIIDKHSKAMCFSGI